jgi:predicted GH43/DUF377 family glycosyl hydrolase
MDGKKDIDSRKSKREANASVIATQPIETSAILTGQPHGYNPSVADYDGSRYVSYRYHPKPDHWRTQMVISKDGIEKPIFPPEQYAQHSLEDGRFFMWQKKLHLSVTIARSRVSGQSLDPCISAYGELREEADGWRLHNWIEPKHPDNTWSKATKNIVYFQRGEHLLMTWMTYPNHVIHQLDEVGKLVTGWRTESPRCPFGSYRGGTQSFPFEGNRLRFCHAVQNNPKATQYWGYSLCAYVFESDPPFRILKVSQQPIIGGNEFYEPNCPHWKPRICIPYGAVPRGDGWKVSIGVNDCECALAEVTRWDLNF